jgi:uncharacterized protein (DUF488 family)
MTVLRTIGYEGTTLPAFLATLVQAGVTTLVDVRDAPVSRKKGFSKTELAAALRSAGIAYVHLRWLGNPKPGRDAGRAGDIATYHRHYFARLATPEAQTALDEAARLAEAGGACLMCFERDPTHCHRTLVAKALAELRPIEIENLAPDTAP